MPKKRTREDLIRHLTLYVVARAIKAGVIPPHKDWDRVKFVRRPPQLTARDT